MFFDRYSFLVICCNMSLYCTVSEKIVRGGTRAFLKILFNIISHLEQRPCYEAVFKSATVSLFSYSEIDGAFKGHWCSYRTPRIETLEHRRQGTKQEL